MLEFSRYHFVGVAGVGMSSVAQAVCHQGCTVTGSDRYRDKGNCQPVIQQLEKAGIKLYQQDGSGVIAGADALVVSTAIEADNPDVVEAKAQGLPVRHRSEVLAQLVDGHTCVAIAGTSGKSTVTGMVGWVLEQTGFDPTVVNGAPVINWSDDNSIGNMRRGNSSLWVIEADESDRSLLNYNPSCAVITNISADHFDLDETRLLFKQFAEKVNGPVLGALSDADYVEGVEPVITSHSSAFDFDGVRFELALPGRHNVENALHAASLCEHMGVALADSAEALRSFKGIRRRLEVVGCANGVTVIDDYGHNPAKIKAAWEAVVPFAERGIAIWRPHGFGPLRSMLDELTHLFGLLCGSRHKLLLLPVYDAGGTADRTIDSGALAERLLDAGVDVQCVASHDQAVERAVSEASSGDVILVMGARDPELPALARRIADGVG